MVVFDLIPGREQHCRVDALGIWTLADLVLLTLTNFALISDQLKISHTVENKSEIVFSFKKGKKPKPTNKT